MTLVGGRKVIGEVITGAGEGFLLKRLQLAQLSRTNPRADAPLWRTALPPIWSSFSQATEQHWWLRNESTVRVLAMAGVLAEQHRSTSRTPRLLFDCEGASVQSLFAHQLRKLMPNMSEELDWIPMVKGKRAVTLAHVPRAQIRLNAQKLQDVVSLEARPIVVGEFAQVSVVSTMHNDVNSAVDRGGGVRVLIQLLNAIAATESRITPERIVAALQHLNRTDRQALQGFLGRVEGQLLTKDIDEEAGTLKLEIARDELRLNQSQPIPSGLRELISEMREALLDPPESSARIEVLDE
jgi:hypothetical protein